MLFLTNFLLNLDEKKSLTSIFSVKLFIYTSIFSAKYMSKSSYGPNYRPSMSLSYFPSKYGLGILLPKA
jgi:hypothetical protein